MGIIRRIRRLFNLSLSDPKSWDPMLWNLYGSRAESGETVTEHTALTYSAVWNAVTLIAGTIGSLPLHLMQRKNATKRLADRKTVYKLMHDQWNQYVTAMAGREALMAHVLLWGNAYAEKVFNVYGDVSSLWPIAPDRVRPMMQDDELVYEIKMPDGQPLIFPRWKILHVPGLGFDGFLGYSVVAMARKSFGLGMAMETFGSKYFGAGTHPSAVVTHPGQLKNSKEVRAALSEVYSGLGNAHQLMLLEEGMKIEKVGIPPEDSQFLESRQFQIPEIARWFNLPPHKLKDLTKSSFNNIESEQISFVTDSILPWLIRLEQNYNMQLLSESDKNLTGYGSLYWKHIVEGLLRGDSKSRSEYYQNMFLIGAMSINEIREKEDMDPVAGGDEHFVPMNMTTLQNAGKIVEPEPAPAETPQIQEAPEPQQKLIQLVGSTKLKTIPMLTKE